MVALALRGSVVACVVGLLAACGGGGSGDTGGGAGSGATGGSGAVAGSGGSTASGPTPLEYVEAKVGTYEGAWVLYGVDAQEVVYEAVSWTDVAVADQPTLEADRAYVHVVDTGTTTDGSMFEQTWIEGVLIEPDGTVGKEFIETDGVLTVYDEPDPGHFVFTTAVTAQDLYFIEGCTAQNLIEGSHLNDKFVTFINGQETHDVTRDTHVECAGDNGTFVRDFQSLNGQHKKTQ